MSIKDAKIVAIVKNGAGNAVNKAADLADAGKNAGVKAADYVEIATDGAFVIAQDSGKKAAKEIDAVLDKMMMGRKLQLRVKCNTRIRCIWNM